MYTKVKPEDNFFNVLVADITHRCNMECSNCYIPNRVIPDMDVDKLYDFISRLPKKVFIRLIGAEPTMRTDLSKIIRKIKSMGHRVSLTTNGLKLGNLKYVQDLKKAGLKYVLISMNGGNDDTAYKILDNGKYADAKIKALKNCMAENMIINTGTIIAKGVNENTIENQVNLFFDCMEEMKYNPKIKPILRFKSVGQIGRNMGKDSAYEIEELIDLFKEKFDIVKSNQSIQNCGTNILYEYKNILIRFIDWSVDDDGVVDSESEYRGRITQDWMCAPFFDDVKRNENGY
tara:strand:+ start:1078 stop:1944 length:867 start_codon:yes stop_codon:yes gene_type:complete